MKIYDISQEIFGCSVYEGDPAPKAEVLMRINMGALYNLSAFSMCAHNGTHVDAPFHFLENGKTIDKIPLEHFVGEAYVAEHDGILKEDDARFIMEKAHFAGDDCYRRILVKGRAEISLEAAEVFADANILLVGNESQTVGNENAPMAVHKTLLCRDIVLLEGIRLSGVGEGKYFLVAAPLNLSGFDGSPCRAILISGE